MGASIANLPYGVHVTLERNDLPDAEILRDEDFVIALFQLFVEFHNGTKGHKFKSLPRRREAVVGILLMMAVYDRISFEVGGVDLTLEVTGIGTADNRRTYKPYRRGIVLVGKVVDERSAESNLNAVEIAHEQQAQVKIEVVEIDRVLKRCALDVFVCTVAQVGIRLFKREQIKTKAIISYVEEDFSRLVLVGYSETS